MASTNKTTHYELSQYVSSDKPTYLVDYNGDMSKIDTGINAAKTTADTASTAATNAQTVAENAATTANTAITNAATAQSGVSTNAANIGTLANLTTNEKTTLVGAINEIDGDVGNLSQLSTTVKTNLVSAVNEVKAEVEDLEPVLLWSNSNPTSNFSAQDIALGDSYDEIDIFYRVATDVANIKELKVRKGFSYDLESIAGAVFRARGLSFNASGNTVTIGDGVYSNAFSAMTLNNAQCIPIQIYGYKK